MGPGATAPLTHTRASPAQDFSTPARMRQLGPREVQGHRASWWQDLKPRVSDFTSLSPDRVMTRACECARNLPGRRPNPQTHVGRSETQREAAGTDPELQESDVTAPASPRLVVIILKAMRLSIKLGLEPCPRQHPGAWAGPGQGPGAALLASRARAGAWAAGTCPPTPGRGQAWRGHGASFGLWNPDTAAEDPSRPSGHTASSVWHGPASWGPHSGAWTARVPAEIHASARCPQGQVLINPQWAHHSHASTFRCHGTPA